MLGTKNSKVNQVTLAWTVVAALCGNFIFVPGAILYKVFCCIRLMAKSKKGNLNAIPFIFIWYCKRLTLGNNVYVLLSRFNERFTGALDSWKKRCWSDSSGANTSIFPPHIISVPPLVWTSALDHLLTPASTWTTWWKPCRWRRRMRWSTFSKWPAWSTAVSTTRQVRRDTGEEMTS